MSKLEIKNSTRKKIFLSYFIVFIIPLIAMGLFNYFRMFKIIKDNTDQVYIEMLSQIKRDVDDRFAEIDDFSNQMALSQWVRKISYMQGKSIDYSRISVTTINNYLSELGKYNALNKFIDYLAIYINDKEIILHPDGMTGFDWFFTHTYKYDALKPEDWLKILNRMMPSDNAVLVDLKHVYTLNKNFEFLTYVKVLPLMDYKPKATLFIMINKNTIQSILKKIIINEQSSAYVFDENNNTLIDFNGNKEVEKLIIKQLNNNSIDKTVSRYITDPKGNNFFMFLTKSNSSISPWTYVALLPVQHVMKDINYLKNISALLIIILFIIGFIFSYEFTLNSHKHLKSIILMIKNRLKYPDNIIKDDYIYIEEGIKRICSNEDNMKSEINKYQLIALRDGFRSILNGQIRSLDREFMDMLECHGYNKSRFSIAILDGIKTGSWFEESLIDKNWAVYVLRQGNENVLIINMNNEDYIDEIIKHFQYCLSDEATIALGEVYSDIEDLWQSYNQAQVAIEYKMLKNNNNIIHFKDIDIDNNNETYYYSMFYEKELLDNINNRDCKAIRKILSSILKKYIVQSNISHSIQRYLFYKRVEMEMEMLSDEHLDKAVASSIDNKNIACICMENIDSLQLLTEQIFKNICGVSLDQSVRYKKELMKKIIQFIENNYYNSTFSLTVLAENFDMTASKMSKFFKDEAGKTFIDYITELRISVAKRIMSESDGKINTEDVAKQVGYDNVRTFRRAFLKFENMTPGKYKLTGL